VSYKISYIARLTETWRSFLLISYSYDSFPINTCRVLRWKSVCQYV